MDPFVGEIRIVPFNFAPKGWAFCNGQILSISQNTALFSLLGTTFGGDGKSNFALPNFQGASPVGAGQGTGLSDYLLGQSGGEAQHTLLESEMPQHSHTVQAHNGDGNQDGPTNHTWAKAHSGRQASNMYRSQAAATLGSGAVSVTGGSQPHDNMPPYLTLNFIIALQGVFPSRT